MMYDGEGRGQRREGGGGVGRHVCVMCMCTWGCEVG